MQFVPFFWCQTFIGCKGPEANLLHHISKTLNFEYSLTNFNHVNGEGKWKIMLNAVHHGVLDWGIGGVSLTPERRFLVDMTQTIHAESYRIMYRCTLSENRWSSWQQIVKPFRLDLWICFLCVLFISVLLLKYVTEYAVPSQARSIFHSFTVVLRLMLEQPVFRFPYNSMSKRIIFINWCLACIILVTVYKSKIVSMLVETYYIEYNSLEDLSRNGYTFLVSNLDWSVLKENWEAAMEADGQYQDIIRKTRNNLGTCEAVEEVTNNKVAYIEEISTLLYQVINDCKLNITPQEFSELCLTKNKVFPSDHVWALQLGAPYGQKFSEVIDRLHSAGILTFWYNSVLNDLLSRTKLQPSVPELNGLNLTTMTCPITILVSGWILSILVFFGEIVIHKLFKLREIRRNKVGLMKKFVWSD
ncbi:hypothetical protein RI129_009586 [Pyrocoelia pectoralis]|uniref:Ionotropic glutamate receptor C-terminal domain-containing protein n=1 Tax=Pyrocoelia pectoralis TaxID=417401 RepID=A0AAN7VBW3_9COLE